MTAACSLVFRGRFPGRLRKGSVMGGLVGPVLARAGGYAFDTWTVEDGVSRGYVYRRIEDARHARKAAIDSVAFANAMLGDSDPQSEVCVCDTLEHFLSELLERGVLVTDSVLHVLYSMHVA
jgi:hypothetical protein